MIKLITFFVLIIFLSGQVSATVKSLPKNQEKLIFE